MTLAFLPKIHIHVGHEILLQAMKTDQVDEERNQARDSCNIKKKVKVNIRGKTVLLHLLLFEGSDQLRHNKKEKERKERNEVFLIRVWKFLLSKRVLKP